METTGIEEKVILRELEEKDFSVLSDKTQPWGFQTEGSEFLPWFTGFHSENRLSLVATINNKIVGFYVNSPSRLKVKEKIVTSFRGTVGVHPDYRSRRINVFTLLVKAVHEEIRKKNGTIYGFPRRGLFRYYDRKIQIRSMKTIPRYIRDIRRVSVLGLFFLKQKSRFFGRVIVREIDFFDKSFNELWETASRIDRVMIVRDREYLHWRYCEAPGEGNVIFSAEENDKTTGYLVIRIMEKDGIRSGWVVDLFDVRRGYVTEILLLSALEHFKKNGVTQVECYISDDYYEKILNSLGFLRKDDSRRDTLLMAKSYCSEVDDDDFYDSKRWFITKADMLFS